jgi:hypothetical protein
MATSSGLTSGAADVAIRAAAGLGAGLGPAIRPAVVLLFLAVVPTAAIAGLLRTLDRFARLVIACAANITILALIAMIMLAGGVWSPRNGLLAVVAITAMCLVAQAPPVRRGATALVASRQDAAPRRAASRSTVTAGEDRAQPDPAGHVGEQASSDAGAVTEGIPAVAATDAEAGTAEIPVIRMGEPGDPDLA